MLGQSGDSVAETLNNNEIFRFRSCNISCERCKGGKERGWGKGVSEMEGRRRMAEGEEGGGERSRRGQAGRANV